MTNNPSDHLGGFQLAFSAAVVAAAAAVNGTPIVDPQKKGKFLGILISAPTTAGVLTFSARLEGSNDGITWTAVKQNDGATDLAFTGAKTISGGAMHAVGLFGSIDVTRGKYTRYRLGNITVTGANLTVSAMFVCFEPPAAGQNIVDEFYTKWLPSGS